MINASDTNVELWRRADADVNVMISVPAPLNLGFHLSELISMFVRVLHDIDISYHMIDQADHVASATQLT